jgi:hypothetical protein
MPYTPTGWVDGTTLGNQTRMNNLETQYQESVNSFEQDLFTPFVCFGLTCAKDGSIANQLDIASGVAFLLQTDGTLRRRAISSTTKTTLTPSTTYYLYIQPDGTLYWSTTNSPAANSLAICHVTTDTSHNISAVTDARIRYTTLLPIADQGLDFQVIGWIQAQSPTQTGVPASGLVAMDAASSAGVAQGIFFRTWNGSTGFDPLSIGSAWVGPATAMNDNGAFTQVAAQPAVGSFGVPVIVAQALDVHVTATTSQQILLYTAPANGLYRASAWFHFGNGSTPHNVTLTISYFDPHSGSGVYNFVTAENPPRATSAISIASSPFSIPIMPVTFWAQGGQSIGVTYTDNGGTPNDYVTAIVERLA